jgi:hypothetical protein
MRTGLLVLGGGSWEIPSFSTDDQARFSSLEKQKSLASFSLCAFTQQLGEFIAHYKNKEEGPWKVQKLNQPKQ